MEHFAIAADAGQFIGVGMIAVKIGHIGGQVISFRFGQIRMDEANGVTVAAVIVQYLLDPDVGIVVVIGVMNSFVDMALDRIIDLLLAPVRMFLTERKAFSVDIVDEIVDGIPEMIF